ncbi:unnamed protein product [Cylicocyclus nassatus]|uniref:CX domain-containing protein n=1 Tax=Cylicocyclus nassatus TaxID=53992 RepID=A0AA36GUP0_CYLNA|nr:unnamed protein product [Cylicocyclus nassatus]
MLIYRLCLVFSVFSVAVARRGGGGFRGSSRARSVSSHRSSSSHSHSHSPRFTKKFSKVGSIQRTSMFRATVFGAAAGYLTFRAGRHIINDPNQPIMFDSRPYYWNSELQTPTEEFPVQCVNKIDPQDPQFGRVYYENETRPTEIAYACAEGDYCCGYDCCQESTFFTSLFRLLVLILVLSVVGVFCIEAFRWALNSYKKIFHIFLPSTKVADLCHMP